MDILSAIILGIIQGLTEFLPISSSGHIEITKKLLGGSFIGKNSLLMTIVLHFGTALSTIVIFKKDIKKILLGLVEFKNNEQFKFSMKIIISMFPAGLIGFLFSREIETLFSGNMKLVGSMLFVTGILLLLADRAKNSNKNVTKKSAFIIGVAQAIAILPGISRSGATISTSVILGVDKEKSARFSFLMVVPLIIGKILSDLINIESQNYEISVFVLFVGFITAFITGIFACKWMINLVKNSNLKYFSFYCFIMSSVVLLCL